MTPTERIVRDRLREVCCDDTMIDVTTPTIAKLVHDWEPKMRVMKFLNKHLNLAPPVVERVATSIYRDVIIEGTYDD